MLSGSRFNSMLLRLLERKKWILVALSAAVSVAVICKNQKNAEPPLQVEEISILDSQQKEVVQKISKEIYSAVEEKTEIKAMRRLLKMNAVVKEYVSKKESLGQDWRKKLHRVESIGHELEVLGKKLALEKSSNKYLSATIKNTSDAAKKLLSASSATDYLNSVQESVNISPKSKFESRSVIQTPGMQIEETVLPSDFGKKTITRVGLNTQTCTHISPTDIDPFGEALSGEDLYTKRTEIVRELAQRLATPNAIFAYVKNHIEFLHNYGVGQTANHTIQSGRGTQADKAVVLAALLRSIGVPAIFQAGEIFLTEEKLKRLYGVEGRNDLAWAHTSSLPGQYRFTSRLIYNENKWVVPNVWVRAYIDGEWQNLDPMDLSQEFGNSQSGLETLSLSVDFDQWFFGQDTQGRFVKPDSFIDQIAKNAGVSIRNDFGVGVSLEDLGAPNFGRDLNLQSDNLGTVSDLDPCINFQGADLETSDLQIMSSITVGQSDNDFFTVSLPTAKMRENLVYLSHTAGLLGEVQAGVTGDIELRAGSELLGNHSLTTGQDLDISHSIFVPVEYGSFEVNRETTPKKSGGVVVFNHDAGSSYQSEINRSLEELSKAKENAESSVVRMARFLRLSGLMANFRDVLATKLEEKLFGVKVFSQQLMTTSTKDGVLIDREDRVIGEVPVRSEIDWIFIPRGYARSGNYINRLEYNFHEIINHILITGSGIEATVWEELFGVPGAAANRILQVAAEQNAAGANLDLIRGDQLGVGNDSSIFARFQEEMTFVPAQLAEKESSEGNAFLWSITKPLEIAEPQSRWRGYGYITLSSGNGGSIASFTTLSGGFNPHGGGQRAGPVNEASTPPGTTNQGAPIAGGPNFSGSSCFPVNFATGEMWHTFTDFGLAGRTQETSLIFERTYLTDAKYSSGDLGSNWVHNWDTRLLNGARDSENNLIQGQLLNNGSEDIVWISEGGSPILFTRAGAALTAPEGIDIELEEFADRYEVTTKGNVVFTYGKSGLMSGRLVEKRESHGEKIDFFYDVSGKLDEVSSALAGSVQISRDQDGRIIELTRVRDALTHTFTYDENKLIESSDFDGNVTKYEYNTEQAGTEAFGLLTAFIDPLGRRVEFEYYDNGRVFRERSPGGAVQTYQYAPFSGLHSTRVQSVDGNTTEYRFDDKFRIIEVVFPDGGRTQSEWNASGRRIATIDELGFRTEFAYDARGNTTSVKRPEDAGFRLTSFDQTYDKPLSITPLVGSATNFTLDPATGDILEIRRNDGSKDLFLNFTYDSFGNLLSTTNNLASYSDYRNSDGQLITSFDALNPVRLSYDHRNRVVEQAFATGRIIRNSYDDFDRVVKVMDSHGPNTNNAFDVMGRVLTQKVSAGNEAQLTRFEYDARDRVTAITDALGQRRINAYDRPGAGCRFVNKPTSVVDEQGRETVFQYDKMQRLISSTDADGQRTRFSYNLRGDRILVIDPDGTRTRFRYDGNRRVIQIERESIETSSSGGSIKTTELIKNEYDAADRLVRTERSSSRKKKVVFATEFVYDPIGRLIQKTVTKEKNGQVVESFEDASFEYADQLDAELITKASNENAVLEFNYLAQPPFSLTNYKLTSLDSSLNLRDGEYRVSPDQTGAIGAVFDQSLPLLKRRYDAAGRMLSAEGSLNAQTLTSTFVRDEFGRKTNVSHSTGLSGSYSYDLLNRLTNISWSGAGESFSEDLIYNESGQITKATREFGVFDYSYDQTNQLKQVSYTGSETLNNLVNRSFTYDQSGNRVNDTALGASTYKNNVQLTNPDGNIYVDQNGLGNIIQRPVANGTQVYDYHPDGRMLTLREFDSSGNETKFVEYFYDAFGRRIAKKKTIAGDNPSTQSYLHLGLEDKIMIGRVEKNSITNEVLYLDGQGIDEHLGEISTTSEAYVTDHLGSVLNGDASGGKSVLGPYGENLGVTPEANSATIPVMYGFTGRQLDGESGLYYYRARSYDPSSGRFVTKDPIGIDGGDANLYRYVGNNPVRFIDPFGLFEQEFKRDGLFSVRVKDVKSVTVTVSGQSSSVRVTLINFSRDRRGEPARISQTFTVGGLFSRDSKTVGVDLKNGSVDPERLRNKSDDVLKVLIEGIKSTNTGSGGGGCKIKFGF